MKKLALYNDSVPLNMIHCHEITIVIWLIALNNIFRTEIRSAYDEMMVRIKLPEIQLYDVKINIHLHRYYWAIHWKVSVQLNHHNSQKL